MSRFLTQSFPNRILLLNIINRCYRYNDASKKNVPFKFYLPGSKIIYDCRTLNIILETYNYPCPFNHTKIENNKGLVIYCPNYIIDYFGKDKIINVFNKIDFIIKSNNYTIFNDLEIHNDINKYQNKEKYTLDELEDIFKPIPQSSKLKFNINAKPFVYKK